MALVVGGAAVAGAVVAVGGVAVAGGAAAVAGGATAMALAGRAYYKKKKRAKIAKRKRSRMLKVFGVPFSLVEFKADNGMPSVLEECISYIHTKFLESEEERDKVVGAFSKAEQNGCVTKFVNELINFAEIGEELELFNYDVEEAVFLLLQYFVELPVSLIPPYLFPDFRNALEEPRALQDQAFLKIFKQIPEISQLVLRRLLPLYGDLYQHFVSIGQKDFFLGIISFSLITSDHVMREQLEDDCFSILADSTLESELITSPVDLTTLGDDACLTLTDGAYIFSEDEEEDHGGDWDESKEKTQNEDSLSIPQISVDDDDDDICLRDSGPSCLSANKQYGTSSAGEQKKEPEPTNKTWNKTVPSSSDFHDLSVSPIHPPPTSLAPAPPTTSSSSSSSSSSDHGTLLPTDSSLAPPRSKSPFSRRSTSNPFSSQADEDHRVIFGSTEVLITSFLTCMEPLPPATVFVVRPEKKKKRGLFHHKEKEDEKEKPADKMKKKL